RSQARTRWRARLRPKTSNCSYRGCWNVPGGGAPKNDPCPGGWAGGRGGCAGCAVLGAAALGAAFGRAAGGGGGGGAGAGGSTAAATAPPLQSVSQMS